MNVRKQGSIVNRPHNYGIRTNNNKTQSIDLQHTRENKKSVSRSSYTLPTSYKPTSRTFVNTKDNQSYQQKWMNFEPNAVEKNAFRNAPGLGGIMALGLLALFQSTEDKEKEAEEEGIHPSEFDPTFGWNVVHAKEEAPPRAELAQSAVVTPTHPAGGFAIITLNPKADIEKVAAACAKSLALVKELNEGSSGSPLPPVMAAVAFGTQLWENLSKKKKKPLPENFSHFKERKGKAGKLPETGGDILIHVKGENQSLCYEFIKGVVDSLPPGSVAKVDDQYGFQFQDGRDLSGFLDGTENVGDPIGRRAAALLPTGGSYVIHQRWIHDLKSLHGKSLAEQEKIFGISKVDSAEIAQKQMDKAAHVARMRDDSFKKIPIVRQSMPFGTVGGLHGLLFIAYSNSPAKFDTMLDRMVGKDGGPVDATMTFSTCVASNYYYVPSIKELQSL